MGCNSDGRACTVRAPSTRSTLPPVAASLIHSRPCCAGPIQRRDGGRRAEAEAAAYRRTIWRRWRHAWVRWAPADAPLAPLRSFLRRPSCPTPPVAPTRAPLPRCSTVLAVDGQGATGAAAAEARRHSLAHQPLRRTCPLRPSRLPQVADAQGRGADLGRRRHHPAPGPACWVPGHGCCRWDRRRGAALSSRSPARRADNFVGSRGALRARRPAAMPALQVLAALLRRRFRRLCCWYEAHAR